MADVDHLNELPDFCRVCGRYCRRKNIDMYSVKEYLTELKIIFSINAEMDRPSLHPPKFCHQCYCTLKRALVAEGDYNHEVTLFKWESHTNSSDCMVCKHIINCKKPGRRPKKRQVTQVQGTGGDHGSPPPQDTASCSSVVHHLSPVHSAREKALALCEQDEPVPLCSFFAKRNIKSILKLGEGSYAEVFGYTTDTGRSLAIKIIPIEGGVGGIQATFQDVLTEMVIMKELSLLGKKPAENYTENFLQIEQLALCQGEYPAMLLREWDKYSETHSTENDRPDVFPPEQLYVVLTSENTGIELEKYKFSSVEEAHSMLCQVAGALAVGEAAIEFEHRDLHISNILLRKTSQKLLHIKLYGKKYTIATHGIKATIIDYTLSRIKQDDCVSFHDLKNIPWIFEGKGDTQFDVYREMKSATNSHWDQFCPYTNVLWLAYLVPKVADIQDLSPRYWRTMSRHLNRELHPESCAKDVFLFFWSQT